ncbi:MAG: hypothetical protein JWN39_2963 [Ilumatobacteraceae bacterium]|nr:hypothetical protein [Ilumatobacteraceae bacterium]
MRFHRCVFAVAIVASSATLGAFGLPGAPQIAQATSSIDVLAPSGSSQFGDRLLVLSNGNYVVRSTSAVYLYNGATNTLISTLGTDTFGEVGSAGILEVGNSNFVVVSPQWNSFGAVTWVNGTTGLNAVISSSNSLVGATSLDSVGAVGALVSVPDVVVLANGNYVVGSPLWDRDGSHTDVGAVTFGSGNSGVKGVVSIANSIYGGTTNDQVGYQVAGLSNGNYVTWTSGWDIDGANTDVGAATWGNGGGSTITTGPVSGGNSIIGGSSNDGTLMSVTPLTANGNYVVSMPSYDHKFVTNDIGAAVWGSGTGAVHGSVTPSDTNALVGSVVGDMVSSGGVTALPNGNYVVVSPKWNVQVGAVTDVKGTSGAPGTGPGNVVTVNNSITGNVSGDTVGSNGVTVLTNGNYVVSSERWHNGAHASAGAATWAKADGTTIVHVGTGNSIVGDKDNDYVSGDTVGGNGVTALANGNYIVASRYWDSPTPGSVQNVGAVTWAVGTAATHVVVGPANSLTGSAADDQASSSGVIALSNGNYVVGSSLWNGAGVDLGAATWATGTATTSAVVSPSNSLVGSQSSESVSSGGLTSLPNGNYVVDSPTWGNGGGLKSGGAVTWADGTHVTAAPVSVANSLVGSPANDDEVGGGGGGGIVTYPNSAYLVVSATFYNDPHLHAGAVTFGGLTGVHGHVTSSNSVIGNVDSEFMSLQRVSKRFTTAGAIAVARPTAQIVTLLTIDVTPPTFGSAPSNVVVTTPPGSTTAVVTYSIPVATDDVGTPTVVCSPPSGSAFPVGTTTVSCTATNTEGLTATTSFTVTVGTGIDFIPLPPARLADTRQGQPTVDGLFAGIGTITGGTTFVLPVAGRGGVAANSSAAALNVTVTEPVDAGFVTVYPCGGILPTASNLNFVAGATVPNAVVTKIGDGGAVCFFASRTLHLVVDVNGSFPPETSYRALIPARLIDTRDGQPTVDGLQQGRGPVAAGSVTSLQVTGRAGVPVDAVAVVLNVTVTEPTVAGYATVYPCGSPPPTASNLNYTPGQTIPNLVVVKVGIGGNVCIFSQSPTQLVADVSGYFATGTTFASLVPARVLDTREGFDTIDHVSAGAGLRPAGTVTVVHVAGRGGMPVNAATAVLNVTVTEPAAPGFVTVYPCGIDPPLASNLNFVEGQTVPNAVITKVSATGDVCLFNSQATQLVVDVTGAFP